MPFRDYEEDFDDDTYYTRQEDWEPLKLYDDIYTHILHEMFPPDRQGQFILQNMECQSTWRHSLNELLISEKKQ